MMHENVLTFAEAAARIDDSFRSIDRDYMYPENRATVQIPGPQGRMALLSYGPRDIRRNVDSQKFSDYQKCFCDWRHAPRPGEESHPISAASCLFLCSDRAHQFAAQCGPEPTAEHYADMMDLTARLREPSLTVVNLPGSGASVPQHFHTQIYPLRPTAKRGESLSDNSLRQLWRNVQLDASKPATRTSNVAVAEVEFPLWGLQFTFPDDMDPRRMGNILYECLQGAVRYPSQLTLSYNLFVHSAFDAMSSRTVTVLFRESYLERVFRQPQVLGHVASVAGDETAKAIAESDNQYWRWAWLECIGGFPARDDKLADVERFDWDFWQKVWRSLSLAEPHREKVRQRILGYLEGI